MICSAERKINQGWQAQVNTVLFTGGVHWSISQCTSSHILHCREEAVTQLRAETLKPQATCVVGAMQDRVLEVERASPESPKPPSPPASQGECPCNQALAGSRAGKTAGSSQECNAEANAGRSRPNCMQISQTQRLKTTPFP